MARPSFQDPSMATPEQVCMLGLYAVGASLLTTMHQTSPMVKDSLPSKIDFDQKSFDTKKSFPQKPMRASPKKAKHSKRGAKSLDLLSRGMPVPASQQPALREFSFNANKLGITGDHLPADLPPSPLSSRVHLPPLQDESPRSKGWLSYLTPSRPRAQLDEDSDDDDALPHGPKGLKKQRSWSRLASLATPSRREQRSASDPDTSATSSTYVPARLGQIPFLPRQEDAAQKPRSRSMSLDVPRLARKSFNTLRSKRAPSVQPQPQTQAPQLGHLAFAQDQSYRNWNAPGLQADFGHVSLRDLPRESISSSESEYSYDRRHSISGSSGHEALHARARGDSQGSFPSTAPSTVSDTAVMSSAFSVSDTQQSDSEGDESDDDEDDIEWERPEAIRTTCTSPIGFEHVPASPTAPRSSFGRRSFQVWSERPRLPSFASYAKSPSKNSTKSSLGGPRRMTSTSSLGGKSEQSGRSSLSELARRSFSQARTLLLVPSPRSAARRSVAGEDTTRPAAVFLQPINTGVISRPCQTTPNPVASTRSNSMTMTCSTTNTIEGSSVRYPSFYLGTSSESGSVTGGSSGNSSGGRSWESTAPELAALEELVLTECKYLADLQLLLDVYVEGLRRLDLITPASLEKIVSNLDEVMVLSRFLIDTVREYLPRRMSPPTSISSQPGNSDSSSRPHAPTANTLLSEPDYLGLSSKLVKELPARMEVYARYCVSHHEAKERLAFERDLRPAVATFIELTRSTNPTLQGMDMDQFLVLPVQRVTRYPLLFGCLAKECGKRRSESGELREEDEDTGMAAYNDQRQGRADAICSNWTRLRDVSSSICGLTNLAISYQQQPARPDTTRSRPRPSMSLSSPLLSSNVAQFGSMSTPPPPALVMREQGSVPRPAPALTGQEAKSRSPAFWRRTSTKTSDKTQADSTGVSSTSSESSGGSSSSLLTRFVKAFRHPAP